MKRLVYFRCLSLVLGVEVLLTLACSTTSQFKGFHDYSLDGGSFGSLAGVLLDVEAIDDTGTTSTEILGEERQASTFHVVSTVNVQIECNVIGGEFIDTSAEYSLAVVDDSDGRILARFLSDIREEWTSKSQSYRDGYRSLPAPKHAFIDGSSFVLYMSPDNNWPGAAWLFYFKGKVVKVTFKEFMGDQGGWGALSSFVSSSMAFRFATTTIRPSYKSYVHPDDVLEKINSGFFINDYQ